MQRPLLIPYDIQELVGYRMKSRKGYGAPYVDAASVPERGAMWMDRNPFDDCFNIHPEHRGRQTHLINSLPKGI